MNIFLRIKFNNDPKKFEISVVLGLIEHVSIITLAIMLFVVFSPYSILLGIVWIIFRIGEGLIFIYNENKYRGLLNIRRFNPNIPNIKKPQLKDYYINEK